MLHVQGHVKEQLQADTDWRHYYCNYLYYQLHYLKGK